MAIDPTITLIGTMLMLALYGALRYAQQTFGDNPEAWDTTKFFTIIGVGIVVVVAGYYATGITEVPSMDAIGKLVEFVTPMFTTLGASVLALLGIKWGVNVGTNKQLVAPVTGVGTTICTTIPAATAEAIKYIGFTVMPSFLEGKSPFLAVFQIKCSTIAIGWKIDWKDGSPVQEGGFAYDGGYNVVNVYHMYTYAGDGKYTGHTFYPEITIISKDGVANVFNTETAGRCLSIGVNA